MVQPLLIILARNCRILALGSKALSGGTRRVNLRDLLWIKAHSCCYCFSPQRNWMEWVSQQAELAPALPLVRSMVQSHKCALPDAKIFSRSLTDDHSLIKLLPCTSEVRTAKANELILWAHCLHLTLSHQEDESFIMFFTGGGKSSTYICHIRNCVP